MSEFRFEGIPAPPDAVSPGAILARLMDGTVFRYYWATEGLRAEDGAFRCCEGSMSILEVMQHIWRIASFARHCCAAGSPPPGDPPREMEDVRRETLNALNELRESFLTMSDQQLEAIVVRHANSADTFSVWHLISGPLTDVLTHIGQINSWRRLNGNPVRKINYLKGQPA